MKKVTVVKNIGVIANNTTGTKEINIVEWQEGYRVIDIRKWHGGDALKGISLNLMEAEKLYSYLSIAINDMKAMMNGNVEKVDLDSFGLAPIKDSDLKD